MIEAKIFNEGKEIPFIEIDDNDVRELKKGIPLELEVKGEKLFISYGKTLSKMVGKPVETGRNIEIDARSTQEELSTVNTDKLTEIQCEIPIIDPVKDDIIPQTVDKIDPFEDVLSSPTKPDKKSGKKSAKKS